MGKSPKKKLQERLALVEKYYTGDKYRTTVSLASHQLSQNNLKACRALLERLPGEDQLLGSLVAKLKGKSIHKTLKKIHEDKNVDTLTKIKGLSSLITHCIIEIQGGAPEFGILLPKLVEREASLIGDLEDVVR